MSTSNWISTDQGMRILFGSLSMFSNFYQLDSYNKSGVASTNRQWNICKNRIENRNLPSLFMTISMSARLLIS